jgi:hypothetical protein
MKHIWLVGSAAIVALTLSAPALAKPKPSDPLPTDYTAERGLIQAGITPAPKVDVLKTATTEAEAQAVTSSTACWQHHWRYDRGYLAFHRAVNQLTFWCSNWSVITYRSTSTWPDTGFLCSVMWGPDSWRSGGGVGSWHVDVTSRGGFSCWLNYFEYRDWIQFTIRYTYYGSGYPV